MKNRKGLKLFLLCVLVGLGVGWLVMRDREGAAAASNKTAAVYADAQEGFDPNDSELVSGTIAVDFKDDVTPDRVKAIGDRLGIVFTPVSSTEHDALYVGTLNPDVEAIDLKALRADPAVEAAEEQMIYGIPEAALDPADEGIRDDHGGDAQRGFPNDPRFDEQWHMKQIHVEDAWKVGQGAGVIVAVIDTGVSRVSDLAATEFVPGHNFVTDGDDASDDHGHGTHVAGTIAQSTNNGIGVAGVAYKARIMPIKVLSAQGGGSITGIAEGIRWAADHGAKVINMSLGGRLSSQVLGKAVKYAHDKGVTVVCAAGNDGKGKVSFPAAFPGSVAVAATQKDEGTTFYSNWGKQIDIAAPGGNTRGDPSGGVLQNTLYQGKDDYFFFQGTSMASPHVAGIAALVVGQGVGNPDDVEKILKQTARKPAIGQLPSDFAERYGAGLIDAAAAVRAASSASTGDAETELGAGAALAALALLSLARRRRLGSFGMGGVLGVVVGACGLFFVPSLGMAAQGMPAWDGTLLGGGGAHGNPFFYSAAIPIVLAAVLYSWKRARGLVAGLALGIAGHLLAQAVLGHVDVRWIPLGQVWLAINGAVAAFVGWAVARK